VSQTMVEELVQAGVHFGHRASRWNPKMAPYIYARKGLIHIIDVRETVRGLVASEEVLGPGGGGRQLGAVCWHQASGSVGHRA
jgi:small subunit ribosomal protein S2